MKKRDLFIIVLAIFFVGSLVAGCSLKNKHEEFKLTGGALPETFLLGTHLCRYPMPPMNELLEDMETLKRYGFNLIKIQTHWAVDEPVEGKYAFERYDSLVQRASELGLYVYMGLTLEQAPAWLYEKFPDSRMEGKNGLPVKYETLYTLPADGKPGPCYDHPGAMKSQIKYISAFVKHFSKYKNILVWNTWQEIAYWSDRFIGSDVCYCKNTQEHFRQWLKGQYGTLENLNKKWGSNFGQWSEVGPHRGNQIGLLADRDFNVFQENEYFSHTLKARYLAIKNADPEKRTVFAHLAHSNIGSGKDWTYARCEDFMGSSSYPAWDSFDNWDDYHQSRVYPPDQYHALYNETWNGIALNFDYVRSANPEGNPVWAAEFQGGPVMSDFQKGRVPKATDIRRWMLTAIGSGVTAISFWVTRAEIMAQENNGFSLLNSTGDSTKRLSEAARIGSSLRKHSDLFSMPTKPKAMAGIIINEQNYQFCRSFYGTDRHLYYSTRGWYHLLWRSGFPVDFVNVESISDTTASQYDILIFPFPLSMSNKVVENLKNYVAAGGNLLCEGLPGRIDENSLAVRGEISQGIAGMAGVEQNDISLVREPENGNRWTPIERTWGEFAPVTRIEGTGPFTGITAFCNYYIQSFNCSLATPIFKAGNQTIGVENKYGKGRIWLIGTFLGHNGTAYYTPEMLKLTARFMELSGIKPQKVGDLLVQKRITGQKEAWIITNPTDKDITESIDLSDMRNPEILIGEHLKTNDSKALLSLKSLDVAVLVFEK